MNPCNCEPPKKVCNTYADCSCKKKTVCKEPYKPCCNPYKPCETEKCPIDEPCECGIRVRNKYKYDAYRNLSVHGIMGETFCWYPYKPDCYPTGCPPKPRWECCSRPGCGPCDTNIPCPKCPKCETVVYRKCSCECDCPIKRECTCKYSKTC